MIENTISSGASSLNPDIVLETHVQFQEDMQGASFEFSEVESPLSLPAALCDEALLKELQAIPDKMGFKIGDVSDLLHVKQYVLRYWETEFEILKPKKAANNQRIYSRKDVENAFLIRKLLHRDRFSIEGARHVLRGLKAQVKKELGYHKVFNRLESVHDQIEDIMVDLRRLRKILK